MARCSKCLHCHGIDIQIAALWGEGRSQEEVAAAIGSTQSAVSRALRRLGLTRSGAQQRVAARGVSR